ncbi:MAG: hypothetical protein IJG87_06605 [Ruminococcus sp.]|nr:hypothetical protein [Ruminococcus sp.]
MAYCQELLCSKGKEYAPGADRLIAFKKAAALQSCTQAEAALGMMAKHIVSVTDMVQSHEHYTTSRWIEKITDSINYLLILRAIVEETGGAHE